MDKTCLCHWTILTDDEAEDENTDLLNPPKNYITFEIYYGGEHSHEIKNIIDTTTPLTNEELIDVIKEYSDFYGVPVPPDVNSIVNNFTFIQRRL